MKCLQALNLRKLIKEGVFKKQLFGFFEALMCAYFPVPQTPPSTTAPFNPVYNEVAPLLSNGEQRL